MSYFQAVVLGLVQGLAEFLPISSSGHLALLQYFFKIESDNVLAFTVLMHLGTLISVFIVYAKDIWALLKELCYTIRDICTGKGPRINCCETRRLGFMIIVATIPTAIIGLLFEDFFESLYSKLVAIGIGLVFTGTIMWLSEKFGKGKYEVMQMKWRTAIFVGIMQGIAICPGVSRSGSTLVGSLSGGLKREFAVKFAFLISIPSILGSIVLEIPDLFEEGLDMSLAGPCLLGVIVAAVSGLVAIKAMIRIVSRKKLIYFSIYTCTIGILVAGYAMLAI
ncbi:MAG: undecaprenyl-diphosphate phosphatase [Firmicutes bacterium]|nr:undecaprenyl-diphosphate phosphatase [Bacillota bacterium]